MTKQDGDIYSNVKDLKIFLLLYVLHEEKKNEESSPNKILSGHNNVDSYQVRKNNGSSVVVKKIDPFFSTRTTSGNLLTGVQGTHQLKRHTFESVRLGDE